MADGGLLDSRIRIVSGPPGGQISASSGIQICLFLITDNGLRTEKAQLTGAELGSRQGLWLGS
jgi:hypothetical protein